jgi:cytochrome c biogenesis protein
MRTALILLLLLAVASVVGSLVPQWPNTPDRVLRYLEDHPFWGEVFERAGLFDVFGSWWFVLLTALLFVSLVACLIPRTRSFVRAVRTRPLHAREVDAFRHYAERRVAGTPEDAAGAATALLRRRFWRTARAGTQVAAEKGVLREGGSLLFHWAFLLILIGVIVGKGTGFSGFAVIVEGDTWVDARANYDGQLRAGRFFDGEFTGIGVRLRSFESDFRRSGQPMDFVSRVDLLDPRGDLIRRQDIRVNHPAQIEGLRIFQSSFGWAPVVETARDADVLTSAPVVTDLAPAPEGVPAFAMPWRGFVKLPSADGGTPDVAVSFQLYPDSEAFLTSLATGEPVAMLRENDPFLRFTVWRGTLTDLATNRLDTSLLRRTATGIVGLGQTASLRTGERFAPGASPTGLTLSFPELRRYSVLQVAEDRGVPIVLLAAILILVGLLPALYDSRRKLWIRAEPDGEGSVLKIGGFALQRKPQFEEEFERLVEAAARAAGGPATPAGSEKEQVGTR